MNIRVHSLELNRMMKVVSQCIGLKETKMGNVEIRHENNQLSIRGTNGTFMAEMSTPVLGGDGEGFCVDGEMFGKVCAMCNGEVSIIAEDKTCTIKGVGRTKMPIVKADIPEMKHVGDEHSMTIKESMFSRMYRNVAYAVGNDQNRAVLNGVFVQTDRDGVRFVSLDGFQMSMEHGECDWDNGVSAVVPGAFMKLIAQGSAGCDQIVIKSDGTRLEAIADGMDLTCGLLTGEFPDYQRLIPADFKTESLINVEAFRNALKAGNAVNSKQNLVRMDVGPDCIRIMSNTEEAFYDAEVPCKTQGPGLAIAFNQKYLMNLLSSIDTDDVVMKFNGMTSPCVGQGYEQNGIRLVLPVRIQGGA